MSEALSKYQTMSQRDQLHLNFQYSDCTRIFDPEHSICLSFNDRTRLDCLHHLLSRWAALIVFMLCFHSAVEAFDKYGLFYRHGFGVFQPTPERAGKSKGPCETTRPPPIQYTTCHHPSSSDNTASYQVHNSTIFPHRPSNYPALYPDLSHDLGSFSIGLE